MSVQIFLPVGEIWTFSVCVCVCVYFSFKPPYIYDLDAPAKVSYIMISKRISSGWMWLESSHRATNLYLGSAQDSHLDMCDSQEGQKSFWPWLRSPLSLGNNHQRWVLRERKFGAGQRDCCGKGHRSGVRISGARGEQAPWGAGPCLSHAETWAEGEGILPFNGMPLLKASLLRAYLFHLCLFSCAL